jgi:hypothetical protein
MPDDGPTVAPQGNRSTPRGVLGGMRRTTGWQRWGRAILLGITPLLVAACAGGVGPGDEPSGSGGAFSPRAVDPVASGSTAAPIGEVPQALLEQILTNAADLADVDIEEIEVLRAEAITWNDGSLGCPEPGMMYTQALVEGYHVVLRAAGDELDYRATAEGDYLLCENPDGPPSGG